MLTFDPEPHLYWWNGIIVDSVTQILGRVGARESDNAPWRSVSSAEFMRDPTSKRFGTVFHDGAGLRCRGRGVKWPSGMEPWAEGLERFLAEKKPEPVEVNGQALIEQPGYCRRYRYAFTPDFPCRIDGKLTVIDWKTSETFSRHWWVQTAAYAVGLEDWAGLKRWQTMPVLIGQGTYDDTRVHSPAEVRRDVNLWLSVLNTYRLVVPQVLRTDPREGL